MKKLAFLISVFFCAFGTAFGQNIELKNNIAYVDGIAYLKLEKGKKDKYVIRDVEDDQKLLKIELVKAYNRIDKKFHKLPQVFSYRANRKSKYEVNIQTEVELIKFIYSEKLLH